MKLAITSFKGEYPILSPELLPENCAQEATNCRLGTGNLMAYRQFVSVKVLAADATTIHKLNGAWLSWNAQVDVARGLIPGDTNFFTFLTGPSLYATPRYTTYTLATTGAEPYPVTTYPLGMPAPTAAPTLAVGVDSTPTTTSVNITDAGDELLTSWTTSAPLTGSTYSTVTQGSGVYTVLYDENHNAGGEPYAFRNFGIAALSAVNVRQKFLFGGDTSLMQAVVSVATSAAGEGVRVRYQDGFLVLAKATAWGAVFGSATLSAIAMTPLIAATEYTFDVTVTTNEDGTKTVVAEILNGATVLATGTVTNTFGDGDMVGISNGTADDSGSQYRTDYTETVVTGSGPNGFVAVNTATSYVYTFANDNVGGAGVFWESAPSPASATVLRPDGVSVTVTTATTHAFDAGYGINVKRIYRAVSGATGDVFMLVGSVPLATADFVDTLDDAAISTPGTPLETAEWDLPPATMQGIIALPNDCMAGFFRNQLCLSVQGHPHAWPVRQRHTTDTDIVSIKNIDNTIVVTTKAFVYTASGNDPSAYSMSQPGAPQACVSKLGTVFIDKVGVAFPSPDGYMVCSGSASNLVNATESIFTKEQWEALTPSSFLAAVYDSTLYFWLTGTTPDAGYAMDLRPGRSFGLVRLSHHALAVYVDPLTDSMFEILSVNSEPTDADLPLASTAVTPTARTIFQWDAHATNKIVYRYRGKLNILDWASTFHFAKIQGADFSNVLNRVYANGALLHEKVATVPTPYRIPGTDTFRTYEQEIVGTSRIRTASLAQEVEEA